MQAVFSPHNEGKRPFRRAPEKMRPRPARMERFLRAMGISNTRYREWTGGQSLREFGLMNPGWNQRMWEELLMENLHWLHPKLPEVA